MQILTHLLHRKEEIKELWATGGLASPNLDEMAIKNAAAQGACSVYDDILNISYEELESNNE